MNTLKTMCCSECKGDNISWRVWADENNNVLGSCEDKHCYCDDCEEQTLPMMKDDDQSLDEILEKDVEDTSLEDILKIADHLDKQGGES